MGLISANYSHKQYLYKYIHLIQLNRHRRILLNSIFFDDTYCISRNKLHIGVFHINGIIFVIYPRWRLDFRVVVILEAIPSVRNHQKVSVETKSVRMQSGDRRYSNYLLYLSIAPVNLCLYTFGETIVGSPPCLTKSPVFTNDSTFLSNV